VLTITLIAIVDYFVRFRAAEARVPAGRKIQTNPASQELKASIFSVVAGGQCFFRSASAGVGFQKDSLRSLHLARRTSPFKAIGPRTFILHSTCSQAKYKQ
jgi:hypothetical protein